MKVVVSADGGAEGRAARRWCVEHLTSVDEVVAVLEAARAAHLDVIVVGKRPHGLVGDAVGNETAGHLVHRLPCPIVVGPRGPADPADRPRVTQLSVRRP